MSTHTEDLEITTEGNVQVRTVSSLGHKDVDALCEQIRNVDGVASVAVNTGIRVVEDQWELTVQPAASASRNALLSRLAAALKPHRYDGAGIANMFMTEIPYHPTTIAVGLYFVCMPPADPLQRVADALEDLAIKIMEEVQILSCKGSLIILRCEGLDDAETASAIGIVLRAAKTHVAMRVRLKNPGSLDDYIRAILAY